MQFLRRGQQPRGTPAGTVAELGPPGSMKEVKIGDHTILLARVSAVDCNHDTELCAECTVASQV